MVDMNKLLIQKEMGMSQEVIVDYYKRLPQLNVFQCDDGGLLVHG